MAKKGYRLSTPGRLNTARADGSRLVGRAYRSHRYAVLFYTLLTTLAAMPILEAAGLNVGFLEAFLALNLVAAVFPALGGVKAWAVAIITFVLALRCFAVSLGRGALPAVSLGVWSVVGLLAAASALRFALRARRIDSEHLYAALDAYLLVGIFLGVFYWSLKNQAPESFGGTAGQQESNFTAMTGIYFSFVTLATLGYGDITPQTDAARGVVVVEAVAGQLYLAVMVSRLVSLQIAATRYGVNALAKESVGSQETTLLQS